MSTDYNPINYTPKTYEDLFLDLMTSAFKNGLLSSDEDLEANLDPDYQIENIIILELSVVALKLYNTYQDLTAIYNAQNLSFATGIDLDIIGQDKLPRLDAAFAVTDQYFYCDEPAPEAVFIPKGTQITNKEKTVVFQLMYDTTLLQGTTEIHGPVYCLTLGPLGNVPKDTLTELVGSIAGINSTNNPLGAYGGRNRESDNDYRERLKKWTYTLIRGTYDAIVNAITYVSAINGYYIDRYWDGYGSTRIIIDPPLEIAISQLNASLEHWKAVDEPYKVVGVEDVPINIACVINVSIDSTVPLTTSSMENLQAKAAQYIEIYLEGGLNADGTTRNDLGIGNDFIPFKCGVYLSEQIPELKNITFNFPVDPVTITASQRAVAGDISVQVV